MAANRSRRSNAGNLMTKLLNEGETATNQEDDVYSSLWNGFLDVENDHEFKITDPEIQDNDDSNSELDKQESDEEAFERKYANINVVEEDIDESRRKKRTPNKSWLLTKIAETDVEENKLSELEQQARMKECLKVAEHNRKSLIELKKRQLEEQEKKSTSVSNVEPPKEAWYSNPKTTYMILPNFKVWTKPRCVVKRNH